MILQCDGMHQVDPALIEDESAAPKRRRMSIQEAQLQEQQQQPQQPPQPPQSSQQQE